VTARVVGETGGAGLSLNGQMGPTVGDLVSAHEGWLPTYMAG
jgi:hypothetical protein